MMMSINKFYSWTLCILWLCLGFVFAQDPNSDKNNNPGNDSDKYVSPNPIGTPNYNAANIVIGCLAMAIGLLFVFVGKRLIKFLLGIAGAITFIWLTIVISAFIVNFDELTKTQSIIILVACVIFAIAGGALAVCLWKVGMVILGFMNGFSLGQVITRTNFVSTPWIQTTIMICLGLGFAIFTIFAMNFVTILYTAFFGSHLFICGVDLIANTGYLQFSSGAIKDGKTLPPSGAAWGMIASVFIITIIGAVVQWKTTASTYQPVNREAEK